MSEWLSLFFFSFFFSLLKMFNGWSGEAKSSDLKQQHPE